MTNESCNSRAVAMTAAPRLAMQQPTPQSAANDRSSATAEASVRDDQILNAAAAALSRTGYDQLRVLKIYCHHGRVVLQGRISTYYLKQIAQEVVRNLPNVKDVDNDLHVICSR